ncbi:MAG: methylmalonyl-CoA epimerase [Planctomycetota bacterium]|nr:methylmalonyl-CoA epimerase [Planctomycetota bacterium]MDP6763552.1 methylmalonyl-CoA epimerase [Planctomycetota bacterium]MDP6991004.1 methylmalonyl-CoA epimerase [Planctomycetota bacterium]
MQPPEDIAGMVTDLHHIAIAVPSIAATRGVYEQGLGLAAGEIEPVPEEKVNVLVLDAGGRRIELVEPAAPDSPVHAFLERRGGGLHHVAFEVTDVDAAVADLRAGGARIAGDGAGPGAHGTRIAFVHPKSTGGVLIELVEDPRTSETEDEG